MNIFGEQSYKEIIRQRLAERRLLDASANYQTLAAEIRVPKSYLSKVMNGGADLSADQLYRACRYFKMDGEESDYMQLLLAHERSAIKARKLELGKQIKQQQAKFLDTTAHIEAPVIGDLTTTSEQGRYYLEPFIQLVHVCLSIPRYAFDQPALAAALNTSPLRVLAAMDYLESLRLIERVGGKVKVLHDSLHLPKESALYPAWRTQMKLRSLARLEELLGDPEAYSYNVVFAASEEAGRTIRRRFLEFLAEAQELATESEASRSFQMSFDLFPWTLKIES